MPPAWLEVPCLSGRCGGEAAVSCKFRLHCRWLVLRGTSSSVSRRRAACLTSFLGPRLLVPGSCCTEIPPHQAFAAIFRPCLLSVNISTPSTTVQYRLDIVIGRKCKGKGAQTRRHVKSVFAQRRHCCEVRARINTLLLGAGLLTRAHQKSCKWQLDVCHTLQASAAPVFDTPEAAAIGGSANRCN